MKAADDGRELPPELDFFRDRGEAQQEQMEGLKRKVRDGESEEEEQGDGDGEESSKKRRTTETEQVTVEGSRIPLAVETLKNLGDRYQVSSHLMKNLEQHGYHTPTPIQSRSMPVLLEVMSIYVFAWCQSGH